MKRSNLYLQSIGQQFINTRTGQMTDRLPPEETLFEFCPSPCAGLPSFSQRPPSFVSSLRKLRELNVKQTLDKKTKTPKTSKASKPKKEKKVSASQSDVLVAASNLPAFVQDMLRKQMKL